MIYVFYSIKSSIIIIIILYLCWKKKEKGMTIDVIVERIRPVTTGTRWTNWNV